MKGGARMTLLIFDCDGVLVDSELIAHRAVAELMAALGRPMNMQQALAAFSGKRLSDTLAAAEAWLGKPVPPYLAARAGERLLASFATNCSRSPASSRPSQRCPMRAASPRRRRASDLSFRSK
jgi:beta-phosphoglucomutase-like phosphatase (HAD superfamily)